MDTTGHLLELLLREGLTCQALDELPHLVHHSLVENGADEVGHGIGTDVHQSIIVPLTI